VGGNGQVGGAGQRLLFSQAVGHKEIRSFHIKTHNVFLFYSFTFFVPRSGTKNVKLCEIKEQAGWRRR
jgi:hypothetical protein